jgi:hypothetical protein
MPYSKVLVHISFKLNNHMISSQHPFQASAFPTVKWRVSSPSETQLRGPKGRVWLEVKKEDLH